MGETGAASSAKRRPTGRAVAVVAASLVAVILAVVVVRVHSSPTKGAPGGPPCQATVAGSVYGLDVEQAVVATTVAGVGKRLGMPDHAVTVALATALQESRLRNLDHGDRDSLGVFQQRPSQGWGTPGQIMTPRLAAASFYNRLVKIPAWEGLSVTDAAQAVQRSGAGSAYAQWEPEARALAQALTGEAPAAFGCRAAVTRPAAPRPALTDSLALELGPPGLDATVPSARGWTVASWLVARAATYGIASLRFDGHRWSAKTGVWVVDPSAAARLLVNA